MSIKIDEIKKDEFSATVATLFCDETGLKMAEIIIRPSEKENLIEARWEENRLPTSGTHFIKGTLSCSPIETATQKTAIIRAAVVEKEGKQVNRLVVRKK